MLLLHLVDELLILYHGAVQACKPVPITAIILTSFRGLFGRESEPAYTWIVSLVFCCSAHGYHNTVTVCTMVMVRRLHGLGP